MAMYARLHLKKKNVVMYTDAILTYLEPRHNQPITKHQTIQNVKVRKIDIIQYGKTGLESNF